MTMRALLDAYLEARGMEMPVITTGEKGHEEVGELIDAIAAGDLAEIMYETADVALFAATVAAHHGVTVEECVEAKTLRDTGRGPKVAARPAAARPLTLEAREYMPGQRILHDPTTGNDCPACKGRGIVEADMQ